MMDKASSHPVGVVGFVALSFGFSWLIQQTLVGSSMGEELGWRGYLLPSLQTRVGPLAASVTLGLLWGLWHLPLALTPDNFLGQVPFAYTLAGTVATSVMFTWVFNHTRGSLLIALLFHSSINMTGLFLATPDVHPALTLLVGWLAPTLVILRTRTRLGYESDRPLPATKERVAQNT